MISLLNLQTTLRDARTFVFPTECAGCGHPDVRVCSECAELLRAQPRFIPLPGSEPFATLPVLSCGEYGETLARMLHAFKESARTGLARDFARRLRVGIDEFLAQRPHAHAHAHAHTHAHVPARFVVPPSTRVNRRLRGFEPLELVARHAGITLWQPLVSVRRRQDQATLGVSARADNMRHSLRARGDLAGSSIILIDDLMTTGSTLTEMARALVASGAQVTGAVVLAHAERRWPQLSLEGRPMTRAPVNLQTTRDSGKQQD